MNLPMIPMLFRARAREVLKKNLSTALMVSFLATLPGLLAQVYQQITTRDLMELLRYHVLTLGTAYENTTVTYDQLMTMLHQAGTELLDAFTPQVETALWIRLAVIVVTQVLTLGLIAYLLKLVRDQQGEIRDVASRVGCLLKIIGQRILVAVKTLLWGLPGMAVGLAAMYVAFTTPGMVGMLYLYYAGSIVSIWLMLRASLHYAMSSIVLADEPKVGVLASVKRSVQLMRVHKMDYVRMYLSFLLWQVAADLVCGMLGGITPVLGTVGSLVCQLGLSLYINTTVVIFYLALKGERMPLPASLQVRVINRNGDWPNDQAPDQPEDKNDDQDNDPLD